MFKLSVIVAFALLNMSLVSGLYMPRQTNGKQFITGPCQADSDCASGCCGFNSGKCAGAVIAQERDGGCGFGDQEPNNNAAQKIQGPNAEKPQSKAGAAPPAATTAAAAAAAGANNAAAGAASGAAASSGSGSAAAAGGDFKAANGQQAQKENASFASLTADSACTAGQNACVGDQFAQCVNGKFTTTSCGAGLTCASLPLVNSPGTSITCTTAADRDARIQTALGS